MHEARRCVREVVVPGHCEHRRPERSQQLRCAFELLAPAAVCQIARRDDKLRLHLLDQARQPPLDFPLVMTAHVQIGDMEETSRHNRTRL